MDLLGTYKTENQYGVGQSHLPYIVSKGDRENLYVQTIEYKGDTAYRRSFFMPEMKVLETIVHCRMEKVEKSGERSDLSLAYLMAKEEEF